MKRFVLTIGIFLVLIQSVLSQDISGKWEGFISVYGRELEIEVFFEKSNDMYSGNITIPLQNVTGIPLSEVVLNGDKVSFMLETNSPTTYFDGILSGSKISGDFNQSGFEGTFEIVLSSSIKKEELPYIEEEVLVMREDSAVVLAGTLTKPMGKGPFPAVLLVTGSGLQDRDENVHGFKVFKILADHLTKNGFAVLRYDDRSVGGSKGNISSATTQDFADDAWLVFRHLYNHKDIKKDKVGIIGHSEGANIAAMVASSHKEVSFIVLMSGSAISGENIILSQLKHLHLLKEHRPRW